MAVSIMIYHTPLSYLYSQYVCNTYHEGWTPVDVDTIALIGVWALFVGMLALGMSSSIVAVLAVLVTIAYVLDRIPTPN